MLSEILAIVTVLISVASTIVAVFAITYSKKLKDFDLNQQSYEDIKDWYEDVLVILKQLYLQFAAGKEEDKQKLNNVLTKLSAKIDMARLFFPNKQFDEHGLNKPQAYRGRRPLIIDFLVFYYNIFFLNKYQGNLEVLRSIQRAFVSEMTIYLSKNQNCATFDSYDVYDCHNIVDIANLDDEKFRKVLISDDIVEMVKEMNKDINK